MPDDLYDRDALAWSEHQASLLRRVARGERVNASRRSKTRVSRNSMLFGAFYA